MNNQLRPLNGIHANAYAAAAAIRIGTTVAGMAMANEFTSARPNETKPPGGSNTRLPVVVEGEVAGR